MLTLLSRPFIRFSINLRAFAPQRLLLDARRMATDQQPVAIAAHPKADQLVEHDGKIYSTVREGRAFILVPPKARTSVDPQAKSKSKAGEHVN